MAIIVRHRKSNKKFILLGTGFGAFKAVRPSFLGGNLVPHEEEGNIKMVCVSDRNGNIKWFYSNNLQVIEVDGIKITDYEVLKDTVEREEDTKTIQDIEVCPKCGSKVPLDQSMCYTCGQALVDSTYREISDLARKKKK